MLRGLVAAARSAIRLKESTVNWAPGQVGPARQRHESLCLTAEEPVSAPEFAGPGTFARKHKYGAEETRAPRATVQ